MNKLFSKKELIKSGWAKTKEHFWFLFLSVVGMMVVCGAASKIPPAMMVVGFLMSISILTISLDLADGKNPTIHDLFRKYGNYKVFVNYILSTVLVVLIILGGLILFVLPGIYLAVRLQFYKFLVIDKEDIRPIDAIKESWAITSGNFWNLFLFMIIIIAINIFGAILLGLGLFVSIPVSIIAYAMLYRKLLAGVSLAVKN